MSVARDKQSGVGSRKGSGSRGSKDCGMGSRYGFQAWNPAPHTHTRPMRGTHVEEAIEDGLEDQEIGCMGAPGWALLGALLILRLVVGVLIVLLGHPGPQRREDSPF